MNNNLVMALWFLGAICLFGGERALSGLGDWARPVFSSLGLLGLVASLGLRGFLFTREPSPERKKAQLTALIFAGVNLASLILYALTLEPLTGGFSEEVALRWTGTVTALFAVAFVVGAVPAFFLDLALYLHPKRLPRSAAPRAVGAGLVTALGFALVFPVNFLAANHDVEYDAAYFKVAEPGMSSLAIARTLTAPVEVYLFYPSGSETKEAMLPYFRKMAGESGGMMQVEVVDQALAPELAEEFGIRENGYVVFATRPALEGQDEGEERGLEQEKVRISTDIDSAKRDLKRLDKKVQKHLLGVTRGQRTVYFLTGHGEASTKERDDRFRKLSRLKRLLQSLQFKVKDLSATSGSTSEIPEDAAIVFVLSPKDPLLPEENEALERYVERGGSLFVTVSKDGDPLTDLLGFVGLDAGTSVLAIEKPPLPRQTPWVTVTDRFGTHASVQTISRSKRPFMVFPNALALAEGEDAAGKRTALVKTINNTFEDANRNGKHDEGEAKKVFTIGWAATGEGENPYRAIVIGNIDTFSDAAWDRQWMGGFYLAQDASRWLTGDEDIVGEVSTEEDVKILHTREGDAIWFYGVVAGVPSFVFLLGSVITLLRRRLGA